MIIAGDKIGQLANRLFKISHLIACSKENQIKLIYPHFDEYKHLYPNIEEEKDFEIFFHKNRYFHRVFHVAFSIFNILTKYLVKSSPFHENIVSKNIEVNLSDPVIRKKLKKKIVILNGWNIRDRINFVKYENDIRRIFSPSRVHEENISLFITRLRQENDILVGVHVRLGDYANWLGGKYFYSLDVYARKCVEVINGLKHLNKKVLFVLCSNTSIDLSVFSGINVCQSTGHIIEDLHILSSCDYIFGPPSTYSMWASFYGCKPLFHVTDKEKVLRMEYFKIHSELIPKTF